MKILDLHSIGQEDWIGFRNKAYKKTIDFVLKWQEKLKETPKSPLTIKIHEELETLQVIKQFSKKYFYFFTFYLLIHMY